MHYTFNINKLYILSTGWIFVLYLRTNIRVCLVLHHNWEGKCLLRGT